MKKNIILLGFFLFVVLTAANAQSSTTTTTTTTYCTTCWDDAPPPAPEGDAGVPVPIDGGLSVLLIAGAAYGAKRIRDHRKQGGEK